MPSNDGIVSQRIICQGGLNSANNFLELSLLNPGAAARLVNYETSVVGGYRRINGYTELDETAVGGTSAEGRVLGLIGFRNDTTAAYEIIAARKDTSGDTYSFYKWTNPGWTAFTTGFTHATTDGSADVFRVRAEVFNFGSQNHIIFVDGVNLATIYDGENWYQLDPTETGGSENPGGPMVLEKPAYVTVFKNHIFMTGDHQVPSTVAYSTPSDPTDWTSASGSGQQVVGFQVDQIKPFRDELYLFGKTNIKKTVAAGDADTGFLLKDVTNNIGCIAPDSVIEVAGNLVFLAPDGIRPIAGTSNIGDVEISSISQNIQSLIANLDGEYDLRYVNAVALRKKSQFRFFISDETASVSQAYGIIGCFKIKPNLGPWEFGELRGIRSFCAWSGYIGLDEYVLHGDHDGMVYRQEVGNTFNGSDITAIYASPFIDFGETEIRKVMHKLNLFVQAEGSLSIDIGLIYDWQEDGVYSPSNYNLLSSYSAVQYNTGVTYDGGSTYGTINAPILRTNLQGSCFSVQFLFVTSGDHDPYTIQGYVIEYAPQGRY